MWEWCYMGHMFRFWKYVVIRIVCGPSCGHPEHPVPVPLMSSWSIPAKALTNPYLNKILGEKEVNQNLPDLISQINSIVIIVPGTFDRSTICQIWSSVRNFGRFCDMWRLCWSCRFYMDGTQVILEKKRNSVGRTEFISGNTRTGPTYVGDFGRPDNRIQ